MAKRIIKLHVKRGSLAPKIPKEFQDRSPSLHEQFDHVEKNRLLEHDHDVENSSSVLDHVRDVRKKRLPDHDREDISSRQDISSLQGCSSSRQPGNSRTQNSLDLKGQVSLEILFNFLIYLSVLILLSGSIIHFAITSTAFIDFVRLKVQLEEFTTTYDLLSISKNKWIDISKTNFIFGNRQIYIYYKNQTINVSTIGYLDDKNYEPV